MKMEKLVEGFFEIKRTDEEIKEIIDDLREYTFNGEQAFSEDELKRVELKLRNN